MEKNTVLVRHNGEVYVLKLTVEQEKLWNYLRNMDWINYECDVLDISDNADFGGDD